MQKDYLNEDTIAAISSAHGVGGIAIVRISGKKSINILKNIFHPANNLNIDEMESHKLYRGHIISVDKDDLDDVLCVVMKSPNSYTGEDIVEIHSHGGVLIPKIILEQCLLNGARISGPGEFTYRAYINGKMDLLQAEAVADIIDSQTVLALKYSQSRLQGKLSQKIKELSDNILDMLAAIEANVDFPEEDIDDLAKDHMLENCDIISEKISSLLSTYHTGSLIKNGLSTAIIGKPNVGKSSLLNNLLCSERAIVSEIPGTTRDFIEEIIDIRGIPLKLIDTAGIRSSNDKIEMTGIEITKQKIEQAELILAVLDSSDVFTEDDRDVLKCINGHNAVIILNKCDLPTRIAPEFIKRESDSKMIKISAKHSTNIELLKDVIVEAVSDDTISTDTDGIVISNLRHKLSLEKALSSFKRFEKLLKLNESPEYLSVDLKCTLDALGEIIGETSTEDLLGKIFSKFCIGK